MEKDDALPLQSRSPAGFRRPIVVVGQCTAQNKSDIPVSNINTERSTPCCGEPWQFLVDGLNVWVR